MSLACEASLLGRLVRPDFEKLGILHHTLSVDNMKCVDLPSKICYPHILWTHFAIYTEPIKLNSKFRSDCQIGNSHLNIKDSPQLGKYSWPYLCLI